MKKQDLPKIIPVFPLSNFIIFPDTTVPLNIFEPRYIEMINDSMKTNKFIGLIQPKQNNINSILDLHETGCMGKITSFKDTSDGRYLIDLNGLVRFKITKEIKNDKPYRECEISFDAYQDDLNLQKEKLNFLDLIEQLYCQNYHNYMCSIFQQFYFSLFLNFDFLTKSVFLLMKKGTP